MNLPVLIPLKDGHPIVWPVIRGLAAQSLPVDVIAVSRPARIDELIYSDSAHGYQSQAQTRNELVRAFLNAIKQWDWFGCFGCMLASDIVLLKPDVLSRAFVKMVNDPALMVVYILPEPIPGIPIHQDIGCMMVRRCVLEEIEFRSLRAETCNCVKFIEDVAAKKWKTENFNESGLIQVVDRTQFGYSN